MAKFKTSHVLTTTKGDFMANAKQLLSKKYISADINDTISKLLGKFRKEKETTAIVFDKGKYAGVVDKRFLLSTKLDPEKMKIHNIVKRRSKSKTPFYVATLDKDMSLQKICSLLTTTGCRLLPVIEKGKVLGVVRASDVAGKIAGEYKIPCDDLASMKPITVTEDTKASKALTLMIKKDLEHLPVVDKDNRIIGMTAFSDMIAKPNFWHVYGLNMDRLHSKEVWKRRGRFAGEKKSTTVNPITNYMSSKIPSTATVKTKVSEAIRQMLADKVSSIVLLKYRTPVGILTISDIIKDYSKVR